MPETSELRKHTNNKYPNIKGHYTRSNGKIETNGGGRINPRYKHPERNSKTTKGAASRQCLGLEADRQSVRSRKWQHRLQFPAQPGGVVALAVSCIVSRTNMVSYTA